ncbi:zinc ribbon domain-containing protein [Pseudogemmatithrix spongiicola]|uniref:Zinc ribbon domain-containing protein n=1 Tax=Pseudogemmatithrix spongiicola TaxID=3062599 RepID=A0AA49Q3N2_9BACT|nr:zinc ribbon domain-containing protein [Gemmatimonadaceae bacterium 'strain 138']WKW13917.1 zinc ribbon domain-containing protein [Gemmatimonadaceae bacterium 'strain 318']
MTTDALDALFRRLVLAAQQAGALARPIDIGEVLDTLVPYRAARRDGLLDTNDDYLHCMMQLLAGERGYIFSDDLLQDDLRNELSAINPDLGVLTTYRTAKVRIASAEAQRVLAGDTSIDLRPPTPAATDIVAPAPTPAAAPATSPATAPAVVAPAGPAVRPSVPAAIPTAPRGVSPVVSPAAPTTASPAAPTPVVQVPLVERPAEPDTLDCPYCSQSLPTDRTLKYCPHCGLNLRIRRCPGCSAEMEAEWKFCVTCGRSAP